MNYPRVLIVNFYGFNQSSGGPITMSNLFRGWPADRLATVYAGVNKSDPAYGLSFLLRRELVLPMMTRGVHWVTQEEYKRCGVQGEETAEENKAFRLPSCRALVRDSLEWLGVTPIMQCFPVTQELLDFITAFKPDVIYSHLNDIPFARLVLDLVSRFRLPLVVHMMDDYPSTFHRTGMFAAYVRNKMHRQLEQIFELAALRMGICQAMCDEYVQRYGKEFHPFHNPVDLTIWSKFENRSIEINNNSVRIVYSGRIGLASSSSILDVCRVVGDWQHAEINVYFDMYVNDVYEALRIVPEFNSLPANVTLRQAPDSLQDISSILSSADILLLPVDFDDVSEAYIRLSMPTKASAYMATGRPILVYGPRGVATVRYAKEKGWGLVVDTRSDAVLREAILKLALDQTLRSSLSVFARQLCRENHSSEVVCKAFQTAMTKAVQVNDKSGWLPEV